MLELLTNPFVVRALIASVYISMISATLGSLVTYRGESFLLVSSAHAAMAGAAIVMVISAYIGAKVNPLLGAILLGMAISLPYVAMRNKMTHQELESFLGYIFAVTMAIAVFFISLLREYASRAWGLIVGDILLLTKDDILLLTVLSVVSVFMTVTLIRELLYISFDPEGAEIINPRSRVYEAIYVISLALGIVVLLKGVGALLTYVFMIAPPTVASKLSRSAYGAMLLAFFIAITSSVIGIIVGALLNIAPSALSAIIISLAYATAVVRRRER